MNPYIGHSSQLSGVEEHRLIGGKGDGMRLFIANNGRGLELTATPSRNGDITRLRFKGVNLSYMTACGYVAPEFYDKENWLKNFTAGFMTTCGYNNIGIPCTDNGEKLYLHGTIGITPCSNSYFTEDDEFINLCFTVNDEVIFGQKFTNNRVIKISKSQDVFYIEDTVENTGDREDPLCVLYHLNMGYPLLDEDSIVKIPSTTVVGRDQHAQDDIKNHLKMEKPQARYQERCYYHKFENTPCNATIFQPKLNVGLKITYESDNLDTFVEWKQMGIRDYVLGLECGNNYLEGRDDLRKRNLLKTLKPGCKEVFKIKVELLEKLS